MRHRRQRPRSGLPIRVEIRATDVTRADVSSIVDGSVWTVQSVRVDRDWLAICIVKGLLGSLDARSAIIHTLNEVRRRLNGVGGELGTTSPEESIWRCWKHR